MKKLFCVLLLIITFSCINTESRTDKNKESTSYYLIRHAEKDEGDPSNKNPYLVEKGLKRAEKWSNYFKNIDLDAIYSTDYNRTMQTALPTAKAQKLEITPYNLKTLDLQTFLKETKNKTILIVGHSDTTPTFVNKITGKEQYQYIDETTNNKLFIVTINQGKITSKLIDVN